MEINKKKVGERIMHLRLTKGMTLEEFGKVFNATKAMVHNWEAGRNLPNKRNILSVAEFGSMTVNELLYGQEEDMYSSFNLTDEEEEIINLFRKKRVSMRDYLEEQKRYIENLEHLNICYHNKIDELSNIKNDVERAMHIKPYSFDDMKKATNPPTSEISD